MGDHGCPSRTRVENFGERLEKTCQVLTDTFEFLFPAQNLGRCFIYKPHEHMHIGINFDKFDTKATGQLSCTHLDSFFLVCQENRSPIQPGLLSD